MASKSTPPAAAPPAIAPMGGLGTGVLVLVLVEVEDVLLAFCPGDVTIVTPKS